MVQRNDDPRPVDRDLGPESDDEDDLLGEAIEEYLALAERDQAPTSRRSWPGTTT